VTVKLDELVAVPFGVVTDTGPLVAPAGTTAAIKPSDVTVKLAATPLNVTDVAPVKRRPPMLMVEPLGPLPGLIPLISGAVGVTVKAAELVAVPFSVVTEIVPVVAPAGTAA
jgi:hypothetical protein